MSSLVDNDSWTVFLFTYREILSVISVWRGRDLAYETYDIRKTN